MILAALIALSLPLGGCLGVTDIGPMDYRYGSRMPSAAPAPAAVPQRPMADRVEVHKAQRQLVLLRQGEVMRSYPIMLGENPVGHKLREGDARTPEGRYLIDFRNPASRFHRSLHISYPNIRDWNAGLQRRERSLGGDIFIHGMGRSPDEWRYVGTDWTKGCIAVENRHVDEIWTLVADGTPIDIYP